MIFNGESKDYIRIKQSLFRPPSPPIEFDTFDYPRGGSRVKKKRFTSMTLPVPVRVNHPDKRLEDMMEELSDWLIYDEPKKLGFKDTDRYYLAEYESMDLRDRGHFSDGVINFFLPDGRRVGEEKTIDVSTNESIHTVTGKLETPWEINITFSNPVDKFELTTDAGLYILLSYEFIEGDRVTLKYNGREVWLNDNRDLRHSIRLVSNYELLQPGNLRIKANHACELKYDERYY